MDCSAPITASNSPETDSQTTENGQPRLCPMTPGHQAIWLDQCAHASSPLYNMGGGAFIEGPLDLALLWQALDIVIHESDALRMVPQGGESFFLLDKITPDTEVIDLSNEPNPEAATLALWDKYSAQPFDLARPVPPWKIIITRLSEEQHGIQALYHHLLMDGFGSAQVMYRWSEVYTALANHHPIPDSDTLRYYDYLEDSQAYCESTQFEKDKVFWQKHLPDLPESIIQPRQSALFQQGTQQQKSTVDPRKIIDAEKKLNPAVIRQHTVSRELYNRIEEGVSSSAPVFLAALALYYSRVSGQNQVVIGVPTLNRWGKRYKSTPGLFTNVMPVVIKVDPLASLAELVSSTGKILRTCYRHQRFPLAEISRHLEVLKAGRTAVFDLAFSFERQMVNLSFDQAVLKSTRQLFSGVSRHPVILSLCEFYPDEDVEMVIEADQGYLFDGEAEQLLKRWHLILQTIVDAPDTLCKNIELIPPSEKQLLAELSTAPTLLQQEHHTVIDAFLAQVRSHPDATALISDNSGINYAELELWSRQIALKLKNTTPASLAPSPVVAFAVQRSPAMIAAILGILRSGAAFMPVDTSTPADRLQHMLKEGEVRTVIVDGDSARQLSFLAETLSIDFLELNQPLQASEQHTQDSYIPDSINNHPALPPPQASQLAYILYTSGSSGLPKGVMIEHSALMSRIVSTYGSVPADRSCQGTQITFDPAMVEIFAPLCQGGAIILPPPGRQTMEVIAQTILRHKASFAIFVPSTLPHFLDAIEGKEGLALRLVWCGGEILSPDLAQRFLTLTGARLINCYGPTEATILATSWECFQQNMPAVLPIGKAIDDSRIYILGSDGQQVPVGVTGEICLGGPGLARGYLNRPELDAERFILAAFDPEVRLYKTGDRGVQMPDGMIYFSGRVDRQIKIRGYRIEPDEIEMVLLAHPEISGAAVKACCWQNTVRIYAWLASNTLNEKAVRHYLRNRLPDYMVPGFIKVMDTLPGNSSGKTDWKALPEITHQEETENYKAPTTPLETELVTRWEDLLKHSPVGIHDNFFTLGGDSLSAMNFLSGLDAMSGKGNTVSLSFFIHHPTIAEIAQALLKCISDKLVAVPLSDHPTAPTVFLAASGHGDAIRFQRLADTLGKRCSLVMLQPPLNTTSDHREKQNLNLVQHYADAIEAQTDGAFIIGGFSIGGILAIETAKELTRRKQPPQRTLLLETVYPRQVLSSARVWQTFVKLVKSLHILNININGRRLGTMISDQGLTRQIEMIKTYQVPPFDGPVDLIISNGLSWLSPLLFHRWKKHFSHPLRILRVQGWHGSMFSTDNVESLSHAIEKSLHK